MPDLSQVAGEPEFGKPGTPFAGISPDLGQAARESKLGKPGTPFEGTIPDLNQGVGKPEHGKPGTAKECISPDLPEPGRNDHNPDKVSPITKRSLWDGVSPIP